MTEKTAQQQSRMKEQTIGVEIEMNNITRKAAAKLAADFFGTNRYEDTACRNGYYTWSAWDAQGREWKFQRDVSIAGSDSEKCELVTPILHYADIETLQELVRRLRKAGARSDYTRGCGVHCHIGAQGHTPQSLRNLANLMASHETLIAEAIRVDQSRMHRYCRTVDPRFLEQLNRKKPTTIRQNPPLQRQPLSHAQPPRYLHQRHGRVQTFPVRTAFQRQAERAPRRQAQELHSALPRNEPDGKGPAERQPQGTAEGKQKVRHADLADENGIHRG